MIRKFLWHERYSDSKYFFLFFFFRPRPTTVTSTNIHNWIWWSHRVGSTRASVKNVSHKRAPDLAWFSPYSHPARFVLFHFSSSVYIRHLLYLSSNTESSSVALCFVLSYAFYWENIDLPQLSSAAARGRLLWMPKVKEVRNFFM